MLTKNFCSDYRGDNIWCNGIGSGCIATLQSGPLRERLASECRHPLDSFIMAQTPAVLWGEAEHLAGLAVCPA